MKYKTIVDIKITSKPSKEEQQVLVEVVKSDILSEQLKNLGKQRYLDALEQILDVDRELIDVKITFVEDTQ